MQTSSGPVPHPPRTRLCPGKGSIRPAEPGLRGTSGVARAPRLGNLAQTPSSSAPAGQGADRPEDGRPPHAQVSL